MRVRCSAALRKAVWRRRISLPTRIYWGSGRNAIFPSETSFFLFQIKIQKYRITGETWTFPAVWQR